MIIPAYQGPLALSIGFILASTVSAQERIPFDWPRESGEWIYQKEPLAVIEPGETYEGVAIEPNGVAHYAGWELFYDRPPGAENARLEIYRSPDHRFFAVGDLRNTGSLVQVAIIDTHVLPGPDAITLNGGVIMGPMVSPMQHQADVQIQPGIAFSPDNDVALARAYISMGELPAREALVWTHMATGQIGESLGNFFEGGDFQTDIARTRSSTAGGGEVTIAFKHRDCASPCENPVSEHQLPAEILRELTYRMPLPKPRAVVSTFDLVRPDPLDSANTDVPPTSDNSSASDGANIDTRNAPSRQAENIVGSDSSTDQEHPISAAALMSNASGDIFACRLERMPWRDCWDREGATTDVLNFGLMLESEQYVPNSGPGVLYEFYDFGNVGVAYVDFPYALPAGSPIEYFPMVNSVDGVVWPQPMIRLALETGQFGDSGLRRISNRHGGLTYFSEPSLVGYRNLPNVGQRFVYNHALNRIAPLPRNVVGSALAHFDFHDGRLKSVEIIGAVERAPSSGSIAEIQHKLVRRGYNPGPVDGAMGPQTRSAVSKFQGEHCLRETGELDVQTRRMIMAAPVYFLGGQAMPIPQPCGRSQPQKVAAVTRLEPGIYAEHPAQCPFSREPHPGASALSMARPLSLTETSFAWDHAGCEILGQRHSDDVFSFDLACSGEGHTWRTIESVARVSETDVLFKGVRFRYCGPTPDPQRAGSDGRVPLPVQEGVCASRPEACPAFDGTRRTEPERIAANLRVVLRDGQYTRGEETCPIAEYTEANRAGVLGMDCMYGDTPGRYNFALNPRGPASFEHHDTLYRLCDEPGNDYGLQ